MARNTMTIRSNYLTPQSIRFYKERVELYESMSHDLGFNVMFAQRGQLTLAQSEATLRSFHLRAEMGRHAGIGIEVVDPKTVRESSLLFSMAEGGEGASAVVWILEVRPSRDRLFVTSSSSFLMGHVLMVLADRHVHQQVFEAR